MQVTIRKAKPYPALSQETNAYSAEVLVDGRPAFAASNDGHGGADRFHPLPGFTYADLERVEAHLKATEPPMDLSEGLGSVPCDLEVHVGRLLVRDHAVKRLARMTKGKIVAVQGREVYQFKIDPTDANLAAFRAKRPDYRVVNGDAAATEEAVGLLCAV